MLIQEVRYALRMWRAHPLLIGAAFFHSAWAWDNTALFSVLNARPAQCGAGQRVIDAQLALQLECRRSVTGHVVPNYEDLRKAVPFDLAAAAPIVVGLSADGGHPRLLRSLCPTITRLSRRQCRPRSHVSHRRGIALGSHRSSSSATRFGRGVSNRRADAVGQKVPSARARSRSSASRPQALQASRIARGPRCGFQFPCTRRP